MYKRSAVSCESSHRRRPTVVAEPHTMPIMKVALVFVAVLGMTLANSDIAPGTDITQCKAQDLECPVFKRLAVYDSYEVRQYAPGKWVSTMYIGLSPDNSEMFHKLYRYISGANDQKMKIPMTAPVATYIQPGSGPNLDKNFTMSFFVPTAHWTNTPKPTASDVFLMDSPELTVFVKAFDGFAQTSDYIAKAGELQNAITDSSAILADSWITLGYDSPYKLSNRRNEVAFIAK